MMRVLKLLVIVLMIFFVADTYAQKKKHTATKKKTSSSVKSKKSSKASKSSRSGKSSKKSSRRGRHRSAESSEEDGGGRVIKEETNDISWTENGQALNFQVPARHLQSHTFIRNTTNNTITFSLFEDGRWTEKTLPPRANTDYSASESIRFKMDVGGKTVESALMPAHFYNIFSNPDSNANELKDATASVSVN